MATKKHNLTAGKDHISGNGGKDLFVGTKGQLGSNDVLNGAGGTDTISAAVSGKHLAPVMTSIEKGIFSHQGGSSVGMDLANAAAMSSLTLRNFQGDASITDATNVSRIALSKDSNHVVTVDGVDTSNTPTQHVAFSAASNEELDLNFLAGTPVVQILDISLKQSKGVSIGGNVDTSNLFIHSLGKSANSIDILAANLISGVDNLVATGSAALDIETSQASGLNNLVAFDGTKMHGGITAGLVSASLTSFQGGKGNDRITLSNLGGTLIEKAEVLLGAGDDVLDITSLALQPTKASLDGGDGSDTLVLDGDPVNWETAVAHFETLSLKDVGGIYELSSDWKTLLLEGVSGGGSTDAWIDGGDALTRVVGDNFAQYLTLTDLGGTSKHKATISLKDGNDFLILSHLAVDATTQLFDGGAGDFDEAVISGNVTHLSTLLHNFEVLQILDSVGSYNVAKTGFHQIGFSGTPTGSVTLNHVASDATVSFIDDFANFASVNVDPDPSNGAVSLKVKLFSGLTMGTTTFGLFVHNVDSLNIDCSGGASTLYLSAIGDTTAAAAIEISGSSAVTLNATVASVSYIAFLTISNGAGVDISGLADGAQAFSSGGATIVGGAGDDVLVGGAGRDAIFAGGGHDTIHGSLSADTVTLVANNGKDTLIFDNAMQSVYGQVDQINNFGSADVIDISALVSSITFGGNVGSIAAGESTLSNSHSVAFFDTTSHMLYIDIDHNAVFDFSEDMLIELHALASFGNSNLIG